MMKLAYGNPIMKPLYEVLSAHLACWSRLDKCWFPPSRLGWTLRFRAAEGKAFGDQMGKSGCRPGQRMGIPGPRVLPLAGGKWGVRLAETGLPQHFPPSYPGWGWRGGGVGLGRSPYPVPLLSISPPRLIRRVHPIHWLPPPLEPWSCQAPCDVKKTAEAQSFRDLLEGRVETRAQTRGSAAPHSFTATFGPWMRPLS